MRKNIIKIYCIILAITIPYAFWVKFTGLGIPCIVFELTGYKCPGCGISRMFISMLNLDFYHAFLHNQAMFVSFFVWNAIAFFAFIGKPAFLRKSKFIYSLVSVTIASWIIFSIIRNVPYF